MEGLGIRWTGFGWSNAYGYGGNNMYQDLLVAIIKCRAFARTKAPVNVVKLMFWVCKSETQHPLHPTIVKPGGVVLPRGMVGLSCGCVSHSLKRFFCRVVDCMSGCGNGGSTVWSWTFRTRGPWGRDALTGEWWWMIGSCTGVVFVSGLLGAVAGTSDAEHRVCRR